MTIKSSDKELLCGLWQEDSDHFGRLLSGQAAQRIQELLDEVKQLRETIEEVTSCDFIWGAIWDVHDMDTTVREYADSVSRMQREAVADMSKGGVA